MSKYEDDISVIVEYINSLNRRLDKVKAERDELRKKCKNKPESDSSDSSESETEFVDRLQQLQKKYQDRQNINLSKLDDIGFVMEKNLNKMKGD